MGVTSEGWLEVVLGGKRLVARSTTSLLGRSTHVSLALVRGNTAVKVNIYNAAFAVQKLSLDLISTGDQQP